MPAQQHQLSPARGVPDMRGAIDRGRHQAPAIVGEVRCSQLIVVFEPHGFAPRGDLPDPRGPVGRRGDDCGRWARTPRMVPAPVWPVKRRNSRPVAASQRRAVVSSEPSPPAAIGREARRIDRGRVAAQDLQLPAWGDLQMRAARSSDEVTTRRLSGEKAAYQTRSVWPLSVRTGCPVVAPDERRRVGGAVAM